jgi:MFS family permease
MLNPVAMSIITNTFTDPKERARAIGVWGGVVGISIAAGPILGGLLVTTVGWPAIFLINVPVGIAALVLTALFVPESKAPRARRIDPVGQVLVFLTLTSMIYAIIEAPRLGWGSGLIIGLLAGSAVSAAALVGWELHRVEPLLDVRFFRSATFSGATLIAVCGFAGFAGFLFVNTLYLQNDRGLSPLEAGLYLLPMAAMTAICAPISGRLVGSRGTRPSLLVAGLGMTAGTLLLTRVSLDSGRWLLFSAYLLFGVGFGMVNAPITNTAVSGMPRAQAGVAAAIATTSRQFGQTLGVAVVGLSSASAPGWWILTLCGAMVLLLGVAPCLGSWRERRRRTRDLAAHVRPRAGQPAATAGGRCAGDQLRARAGGPAGGAHADVDGRVRDGAGPRPAERDRGRRRLGVTGARAAAAASDRPPGEGGGGDAQGQGHGAARRRDPRHPAPGAERPQ